MRACVDVGEGGTLGERLLQGLVLPVASIQLDWPRLQFLKLIINSGLLLDS